MSMNKHIIITSPMFFIILLIRNNTMSTISTNIFIYMLIIHNFHTVTGGITWYTTTFYISVYHYFVFIVHIHVYHTNVVQTIAHIIWIFRIITNRVFTIINWRFRYFILSIFWIASCTRNGVYVTFWFVNYLLVILIILCCFVVYNFILCVGSFYVFDLVIMCPDNNYSINPVLCNPLGIGITSVYVHLQEYKKIYGDLERTTYPKLHRSFTEDEVGSFENVTAGPHHNHA